MASKCNSKPNIVFILSDDQGAWAMGCAGNHEIRTPNLDRLAREGIRFDNFFCASPVCSPARASILTGRIPSAHGVHDWIRSGNVDVDSLSKEALDSGLFKYEKKPIEYLKGQTTYTEILAQNGYTCGLSGKWHLGDSARPQKGFSHWFTIARGGCNYYRPDMIKDGKVVMEEGYITDLITEDALNFLDQQKDSDSPFYLSVHYTAPHSPWGREQHPAEIYDSYADCPFESVPDEPIHLWQIASCPNPNNPEERKALLQGYYAAVTAMDLGIGKIIDKLEELGLRENTLIIFMSDNGMNMGHHGIWGKGNGTFPLNMYDTSIKVPAIVSRPGYVPEGVVNDDLLSQYDIMPTILDYLGYIFDGIEELPGVSFAPILRGKKIDERKDVVVFDEYGPVRMIRTKEWKYVHRYPYGPNELYNLVEDPDEKVNLINEEEKKEIVKELKAKLDSWFYKYTDPKLDGTKEAVTGFGQLNLAGPAGKGEMAFHPGDGAVK